MRRGPLGRGIWYGRAASSVISEVIARELYIGAELSKRQSYKGFSSNLDIYGPLGKRTWYRRAPTSVIKCPGSVEKT